MARVRVALFLGLAAIVAFARSAAAATPAAGSYEILNGPGAGQIVEAQDGGTVQDPALDDDGFIGTGPDCPSAHYHGVLGGLPDPAPEGCGWGEVQMLTGSQAPPFTEFGQALNAVGNADLKQTLLKIGAGIEGALKRDCASALADEVDALLEELIGAILRGSIAPADAVTIGKLAQAMITIRDALDGIALAIKKGKVPKPKKKCSVNLFVKLGSGKSAVLGFPGKRFIIHPGQVLRLQAEGAPPGGTYAWSFPNAAESGSSTSNTGAATFFSLKEGKFPVKVTYTCPNPPGGMATASLTVVVDGSYLR